MRDVIIIGSGPAGYTAAVYAGRAALSPLVFEGSVAGGSLMTTTDVENFPGFVDGILGPELMDQLRSQAARFGAELLGEDVVDVDLGGTIKSVCDSSGAWHEAKTVVLATGSRYRQLGLTNETRLAGRGVSSCATCDGFFFRGRDVVVVGGGDSAMEEATFLARFAQSVTVVHRRGAFRASKIMQLRAEANDVIAFRLHSEVVDILGDHHVTGVEVKDLRTGVVDTIEVAGVFVAIGHVPRSELFASQLALDHQGYVVVDHPRTTTSQPGVFACGDLVDHTYRQAVSAAGTGCAAAIDAERHLAAGHAERGHNDA